MRSFLSTFLLSSILVACTVETTERHVPAPATPGSPTGAAPTDGDPTSTSSSSSSGSDGTSSSSTSSSSSSSTGGVTPPPSDTRLFPAEIGRVWTFSATQVSQGQTTTSTTTTTITGQENVDGHPNAYVITSSTSTTAQTTTPQDYQSYVDIDGDNVLTSSTDGQWMPTAKAPVAEGATWTYSYSGTRTQTWHDAKTQTVSAGTFNDCWRIDYTVAETSKPGDVNYSIMCRGVGTILTQMQLSNGFTMHQELTKKSF